MSKNPTVANVIKSEKKEVQQENPNLKVKLINWKVLGRLMDFLWLGVL